MWFFTISRPERLTKHASYLYIGLKHQYSGQMVNWVFMTNRTFHPGVPSQASLVSRRL